MLARLSLADLPALVALEARAQGRPWGTAQVQEELAHEDAVVVGAFVDDTLAAWMALRFIGDELWVLNIATEPSFRRRGLGRELLAHAADVAHARAAPLWLEVRAGNEAAIALYGDCGFVVVGRRPGYYPPLPPHDRPEDALVMQRVIAASGETAKM